MSKKASLFITLNLFSVTIIADDFYIVKKGDTLSQIVMDNTSPPPPLYGNNGRIQRVMSLNPFLSSSDLIRVGDKIFFKEKKVTSADIPLTAPSRSVTMAEEASKKEYSDSWTIGATYGAFYLSYKQTGDLGNAQIGQTIYNNLQIYSKYTFDKYSLNANLETFDLSFESDSDKESQKIVNIDIEGSYKWITTGVAIKDSPIFKNSAGDIDLSKISILSLRLGVHKKWSLPVSKDTYLEFKTVLDYPLSSSSSSSSIKTTDIKGFSVLSNIKLSRALLSKESYLVNAVWPIYLNYSEVDSDIDWEEVTGNFKSTAWNVGTRLGLEVKF